jgi:hypothetical protein
MTQTDGPRHVVVDGSNIATEGRSVPSLAQLNDAVLALVAQYPDVLITVVVDATFGHRIDKTERDEFDEAIANNELVAPPAGAVGRGDAFVLGIADKANAAVLSNDSFQEFHGRYEWLFDSERLIGGKPVPHVGWVFVERVPVRGPVSRQATRTKRPIRAVVAGAAGAAGAAESREHTQQAHRTTKVPMPTERPPNIGEPVNEVIPFLEFAERYPAGTVLEAVVQSYSSHGAYAMIGDVRVYLPLRLMGPPVPTKARDVVELDQTVMVEVRQFSPARRSIDCALIADAQTAAVPTGDRADRSAARASGTAPARKSSSKRAPSKSAPSKKPGPSKSAAAKKAAAMTPVAKKPAPSKAPAAKKAAAMTPVAKKPAPSKKPGPSKSAAAKKAAAMTPVAKKRSPSKAPAAKKRSTSKSVPAKRAGSGDVSKSGRG